MAIWKVKLYADREGEHATGRGFIKAASEAEMLQIVESIPGDWIIASPDRIVMKSDGQFKDGWNPL